MLKISLNDGVPFNSMEKAFMAISERSNEHPESWVRIFIDGSASELEALKDRLPEFVKPHEVTGSKEIALSINLKAAGGKVQQEDWNRAAAFIGQAFISKSISKKLTA